MKKIAYIITALALLVSCIKEPIYNTTHPTKGTAMLSIDWADLHAGESVPSSFALDVGGDEYIVVDATLPILLDPQAQQEFLMHSPSGGMSISDGIATLLEATRVAQDPEPLPESLYYDWQIMDIVADRVHNVSITPKRGNAMLTLKLNYKESEAANIQEITVTLSGIAATRNLRTDAISDEVTLTHYPDFGTASPLELKFNIFGTIGTEQILTIAYTTIDGVTKAVSSNLSSQLASFNTNMEALTLTGDMNLPTDLEAEGSISDWTTGSGGSGTAN